jgi:hypothetical protein
MICVAKCIETLLFKVALFIAGLFYSVALPLFIVALLIEWHDSTIYRMVLSTCLYTFMGAVNSWATI